MRQVQVNLRLLPEQLEAVDRARGITPRNAWLSAAVDAALSGAVVEIVRAPPSGHAGKGCRVLGVPQALREAS